VREPSRPAGVSRRRLLTGALALTGGGLLAAGSGARAWAVEGPEIVSCDGWGARPPDKPLPVHDANPVKILVHHTAGPNRPETGLDAAVRTARSIQDFHMDGRGWGDSGQHFTISRGGVVLEGRHHSLEFLRVGRRQVEGAHCTGQNAVALGIENEGTYTAEDPPGVLWDRLRTLCAYLCAQYGIGPTQIFGHRDFKDTACPGDRLYGMLPQLRGEVARLLGQDVAKADLRAAAWPLLRIADRGDRVRVAQHLLRAAGATGLPADGRFTRATADAVRAFQARHGVVADDGPELADEPTGMIGGATWPLLARPVRAGDRGEAGQAVAVLLRGGAEGSGYGAARVPDLVTPDVWRRLLSP
jgi:hypothetical protein